MCCAYMSMVSWQNWLINCDWTFVHRIRRPQGCDLLSGMETKIQTRNTLAHVLHHPSFIITMYLVTFIIVIVIIFDVTRNETKKAELEACAALADNFKSGAQQRLGRYDFGLFLNFITGKQGLLCVTETWRYGYIRDYGDRVETPHGTTIGCEKSSNGL